MYLYGALKSTESGESQAVVVINLHHGHVFCIHVLNLVLVHMIDDGGDTIHVDLSRLRTLSNFSGPTRYGHHQ